MELPNFYNPDMSRDINYAPDNQLLFEQAAEYRRKHNIKSASTDKRNIQLLSIDLQKDFCFQTSPLYVGGRSGTGAMDDNRRIAEMIYRNIDIISGITVTLDSHVPWQIFFATFWLDGNDQPVNAHTVITTESIKKGEYRPNPAAAHLCGGNYNWLCRQVTDYAEKLEKAGKYTLYIWPFHCLMGSRGYDLAGIIDEATMFHSFVRGVQRRPDVKGLSPFTENYSVFSPEVMTSHNGITLGERNTQTLDMLCKADAVIIVGQAASHCVKSSIDDLLDEINQRDPSLAEKVYVVRDCMSSVVIPGLVDFTDASEDAFRRFSDAGMHVVESTTDVRDWPGMKL
ncbi:MAG: hypothetical protein WC284_04430 [Candidimonas sp.]